MFHLRTASLRSPLFLPANHAFHSIACLDLAISLFSEYPEWFLGNLLISSRRVDPLKQQIRPHWQLLTNGGPINTADISAPTSLTIRAANQLVLLAFPGNPLAPFAACPPGMFRRIHSFLPPSDGTSCLAGPLMQASYALWTGQCKHSMNG